MKALSFALVSLLLASTAFASHPLRVEDVHTLARLGGARVSPDGKWVAFTVTRSDVAHNRSVTNIWMMSTAGGAPQQLTFADTGANSDPRWSPDSQYLYFLSSRIEDKSQIFRLAVGGGEAKQMTSLVTGVNGYVVSPDGKWIGMTSTVFPSTTRRLMMPCSKRVKPIFLCREAKRGEFFTPLRSHT